MTEDGNMQSWQIRKNWNSDSEAWWEELLRDGRFRERVAQARDSVREGRGVSIEELRKKHDIPSQAAGDAD